MAQERLAGVPLLCGTECKTTDVCDVYPDFLRSNCPYLDNTCTACPAGQPLSQC